MAYRYFSDNHGYTNRNKLSNLYWAKIWGILLEQQIQGPWIREDIKKRISLDIVQKGLDPPSPHLILDNSEVTFVKAQNSNIADLQISKVQ